MPCPDLGLGIIMIAVNKRIKLNPDHIFFNNPDFYDCESILGEDITRECQEMMHWF